MKAVLAICETILANFTVETINILASLATIATVLVSAIKYFKARNDDKKRASRNLYLELKDTLESLEYKGHEDEFYHVEIKIPEKKDGKYVGEKDFTAYFMNRDLNHDFYDSLIFSGQINFLEPKLQQQVQDTFKRIKNHNKYLHITKNMGEEDENNTIPRKSYSYYHLLDKDECRLKEEIPEIMKQLQEYFDIKQMEV